MPTHFAHAALWWHKEIKIESIRTRWKYACRMVTTVQPDSDSSHPVYELWVCPVVKKESHHSRMTVLCGKVKWRTPIKLQYSSKQPSTRSRLKITIAESVIF
jgi:hypothetical protein